MVAREARWVSARYHGSKSNAERPTSSIAKVHMSPCTQESAQAGTINYAASLPSIISMNAILWANQDPCFFSKKIL